MEDRRLFYQGIVCSLSLVLYYILGLVNLPSVEAVIPEPRWAHGAVLINNMLYIYGGKVGKTSTNNASQDSTQLLQLDMTQSFSVLGPNWMNGSQGPQVAYHTVGLGGPENDLLIVCGGESGETPPPTNSLYYCDIHTEMWDIPELILPRRSMHTATTRNDSLIFIFGGINTTTQIQTNDLLSLNTTNTSWSLTTISSQANTPPPRYRHTSTILADGKMYVIGGISGNTLVNISQVYVYDTYKGSWNVQMVSGTSPLNRAAHTAVGTHDGKIIVHGGADATFTTIYRDTWILDTTKNPYTWANVSVTGKTPLGRYSHTATMVGSNMIIAFGYMENNVADANIYVLDTTNHSWVNSYQPNNLHTNTESTSPTNVQMSPTLQSTNSHPPMKNDVSSKIVIIVVATVAGIIVTLILLATVIKFCKGPCRSKNHEDNYSFIPQYPQPKNRDSNGSSTNSGVTVIPPLTYLEGAHEKTYSQALDDQMMGIDIQRPNMILALVPKAKLRVANPDEPDVCRESG